jgi:hypothetical protein
VSKHPTSLTDQEKLSLASDLDRIAETLFPEDGVKLRAAADLIVFHITQRNDVLKALGLR